MRKIALTTLPVLLIVILLLTITEKSIGANSNDIQPASAENNISAQVPINVDAEDTTQSVDKPETTTQEHGIDENGVVTFNDTYFDYLHYEVEKNPSKYKDKEVIITGFVYKSDDFEKNEFKVARMASSFCSDPPYVLGLMIQTEDAENFKHREWVTVKGKFIVTSYIDPKTNFEYENVHVEPESIEIIETRPDYFLY